MCGIVGVLGRPSFKSRTVFEDMLQLDVLRGPHSTGVAAFGDKRDFLQKGTLLPTDLIMGDKYDRNVRDKTNEINCYLGHNRFATEGKIVKRNAHPFRHGHVVMVHNGTLTSKINTEFDTDSEGIAWSIANKGIKQTWRSLRGAATLVWWDSKGRTINMITNGQRPLFFATSVDGEQVVWASEPWIMKIACERRSFRLSPGIIQPKPNQLFTFIYDNDKKQVGVSTEMLEPWRFLNYGHHGGHVMGQQRRSSKSFDTAEDYELASALGYASLWPRDDEIPFKSSGSVDKGGEKDAHDHCSDGACSVGTGDDVRVIDTATHRYNPVTFRYEPKELATDVKAAEAAAKQREELATLDRKIAAAKERQKDKQPILRLPKLPGLDIDMNHPDIKALQRKSISKERFEKQYKSCLSCDDALEYEEAIIVDDSNALCGTCQWSGLSQGLSINDLVQSTK